MKRLAFGFAAIAALAATGSMARDRLGVWNDWGAFRDAAVPRCYAIAVPSDIHRKGRDAQPFATVATWPRRAVRGEIHLRLSRAPGPNQTVMLFVGGQKYPLLSSGIDAWAADRRMDATIIAALRNGGDMTVITHARDGRMSRDTYRLAGIASAMDAASLGCAGG